MQEKFYCTIESYDVKTNTCVLKIQYNAPSLMETFEKLQKDKKIICMSFTSQFKELKTYKQLRAYFELLRQILEKSDIPITKENVLALDRYIMENLYPCATLELQGHTIVCPPSKAMLSKEQFSVLLQNIIQTFAHLDIGLNSDLHID